MRNYINLITEYQKSPDPSWDNIPDSDGSQAVGRIVAAKKQATIKARVWHNGVEF